MNNAKEELAKINEEIESLEARKRAIYADSLNAPADQKVCEDWAAEMLTKENNRLKYPVELCGINWVERSVYKQSGGLFSRKPGAWVAIRPCDENKTYLGVLLGEIALGEIASYDKGSGILSIERWRYNPAIWVPDLSKIVFGAESWWGELKAPEDLRQITDADIKNIWYVQALKALHEQSENMVPK